MVLLKKLNPRKDVTKKYKKWMNDKEVHKFSAQKLKKHTLSTISKYVNSMNSSKNEILLGIFIKIDNNLSHIGNIKIGPINFFYKTAYISYFIGEKNLWKKGYGTQAIKEAIKIAKKKKIRKLKAGFVEINPGSKRVLEKNGFKKEGTLKSEEEHNKKRYNAYIYGKAL